MFLCQKVCSVAHAHTDTWADRHTDTKVKTEDTLPGFQEFLLQPIYYQGSVQYLNITILPYHEHYFHCFPYGILVITYHYFIFLLIMYDFSMIWREISFYLLFVFLISQHVWLLLYLLLLILYILLEVVLKDICFIIAFHCGIKSI